MIKGPYSCSSERGCGPHRLSSCNGSAYESSNPVEDGELQPPDAARAICYFALSATRSLIKRPTPSSSSSFARHFSSPRQHTTCRLAAAVLQLFFHPRPPSFLLPGGTHPRRADASRRGPENPRAKRDFGGTLFLRGNPS